MTVIHVESMKMIFLHACACMKMLSSISAVKTAKIRFGTILTQSRPHRIKLPQPPNHVQKNKACACMNIIFMLSTCMTVILKVVDFSHIKE